MKIEATIFAKKGVKVEEGAISQLKNAASLPGVAKVLGMPDIHHGYGVPIGSVIAAKDIVIPAAVGYDINCGMRLILTSFSEGEVDVKTLAQSISRDIPLGEGKKQSSP